MGRNEPPARVAIDFAWVHRELARAGVTLQTIWVEYRDGATGKAPLKSYEYKRLSHVQVVELLVEMERRQREARNLATHTKMATVGAHTTMDCFDWSHPRKIDRVPCENVLGLGFVERERRFLGPSGVGKTMLAQNVCLAALGAGMTVCFTPVVSALAGLLKQESLPAVERRMKRYTNVDLLVCDELGYVPVDKRAVDLFFQIISRRHERASTIISTNLAFKEWGGVSPGAACLVALIDRFTQHLHTIDVDAELRNRCTNRRYGAPG